MKRISPAIALLLIAPVVGELVSGHQAPAEFFNPIVFLALALPYGCGALLCREFTRRWRSGWPGMLFLGAAYGLYEEGVVSRALFNPEWHEAMALAGFDNVAGFNWTYGTMLVHFHVTISVVSSVLLAEMLFPARRHERWLTNGQAALCGAVLALWAPVLAWLARSDDPLYMPPLHLWIVISTLIVLLVLAARFVRSPAPVRDQRAVPTPVWFYVAGMLSTTVVLGTVLILPESGWHPPLRFSVPLLIAFDALTLSLLVRWSGGGGAWEDRHRLALVAGWLTFFLVVSALGDLERFEGRTLVAAATLAALIILWRRIAPAR